MNYHAYETEELFFRISFAFRLEVTDAPLKCLINLCLITFKLGLVSSGTVRFFLDTESTGLRLKTRCSQVPAWTAKSK